MATCKCNKCGHEWTARVLEDDPTTNSFVLKEEDDFCPECQATEFDVMDGYYSDPFMD